MLFRSLLSNAVQHTAAGQVIEVNIEVQEHQVAIGVTNPGDEIASEHLPRLFERFYRVDASRSNSGANHGLGLAIVKAIALMHGGDLSGAGADPGVLLPQGPRHDRPLGAGLALCMVLGSIGTCRLKQARGRESGGDYRNGFWLANRRPVR